MKSSETTSKSHKVPSRSSMTWRYAASCRSLTVRNAHSSTATTRPSRVSGNAQKLCRSSANTIGYDEYSRGSISSSMFVNIMGLPALMVMPPMPCPGASTMRRWRSPVAPALYIHLSGAPMNAVNPMDTKSNPYRSLMSFTARAYFSHAPASSRSLKLDAPTASPPFPLPIRSFARRRSIIPYFARICTGRLAERLDDAHNPTCGTLPRPLLP